MDGMSKTQVATLAFGGGCLVSLLGNRLLAEKRQPKGLQGQGTFDKSQGVNGDGYVVRGGAAKGIANYPHLRRVNGMLYVSGTSSRRADNTHVGATQRADGTWDLDVAEQTTAVIENMRRILKTAGADLGHLVSCTVYLVDMRRDYKPMNAAYNKYFDAATGPGRVLALAHVLLLLLCCCSPLGLSSSSSSSSHPIHPLFPDMCRRAPAAAPQPPHRDPSSGR